jgi:alkyl hydroperoxide reductase subunit AhpC
VQGKFPRPHRAYRHPEGVCERALFVIDSEGKIRWSYLSPIGVNPGADGILTALESFPPRQQTSMR